MIEAAIVGRSVHTMLFPEYEDTQGATFHFDYLFTVGGGILRPARSFEENEDQLAAVLAGTDEPAARSSRGASSEEFVRPYGLDVPATPRFVAEVERLGARGHGAPPRTAVVALPAARRWSSRACTPRSRASSARAVRRSPRAGAK